MRRLGTAIALTVALAVIALVLAACDGGDAGETTSPAPSESPSGSATPPSLSQFPPEFLACLEDQGIDLESVTDVSAVIHSPEGERCFEVLHGGG